MFRLFKFILVDVLVAGVILAGKIAWAILRPIAMFLYRAHAVFFRNLFADKTSAGGDPFAGMKPTRRG